MAALLKTFVLREETHMRALWSFLKANARSMADAGKPLSVSIAEHKSKRSQQQNKRYWAVLREISENAWIDGKQFSSEAWHEFFRRRFIGLEETPGGGTAGISTTGLSVPEFGDYMTACEAYAASELGVEIL